MAECRTSYSYTHVQTSTIIHALVAGMCGMLGKKGRRGFE